MTYLREMGHRLVSERTFFFRCGSADFLPAQDVRKVPQGRFHYTNYSSGQQREKKVEQDSGSRSTLLSYEGNPHEVGWHPASSPEAGGRSSEGEGHL